MNTPLCNNKRRIGTTALTLVILAGAPASAIAQYERHEPTTRRANVESRETSNTHVYHFAKSGTLIGANVVNDNRDTIASVSDLIIDRGSGEIRQALLKSGDVLGIGGKTIAVPFEQLAWDNADRHFSLSMTKEQIDRAVEFDPKTWPNLDHTTWSERVDRWWNGDTADDAHVTRRDAGDANDDWSRQIRDARTERVDGTISHVRRESIGGDEQIVAVVKTRDGGERELLLGPSWFVMGAAAAPMRGDSIQAQVATVNADGARRDVVTSATIQGQRLTLRDTTGAPRWNLPAEAASAGEPGATGRLILLSDLIGAKATPSSDKDAGEIQNAIIEYDAGRVAILGFDPNEAFLGLGDEIKCVPWSVVNVSPDGTVRIDASDEALSNCEKMPDDVTSLQMERNLEPVYAAFDVPVQKFEKRADASRRTVRHGATTNARDAEYFKSFASGKTVNFSGEVVSVTTRAGEGDASPVRVLTLSTDQGQRTVILAPEWYMTRQPLSLNKGDRVSVMTHEAEINGRTQYAAWSINTPDRQFTFWNGSKPVWNDG
ncbi:MAG: PRC-barrel domain-containing protein [Phycisphaerales bacterium]